MIKKEIKVKTEDKSKEVIFSWIKLLNGVYKMM